MFVIVAMIGSAVFLMFSDFGKIKLGQEDDEPEFSLPAWFAMLFSAGMGIGLMFFTTAETISHAFMSSPNANQDLNKIGRASCRERVKNPVLESAVDRKVAERD